MGCGVCTDKSLIKRVSTPENKSKAKPLIANSKNANGKVFINRILKVV